MNIKCIIPVLAILFQLPVFSQNTHSLNEVIVYRQGAKITGTAQLQLSAGTFEQVISNLPASLDPNSIQVNLQGKAILLSASSRVDYMGKQNLPAKVKMIEDSIKLLTESIDWLNNEQAIYQGEEKLITENQKITNEKEKVTAAEIAQLADFYRNRLMQVRKLMYKNNLEIKLKNERKTKLTLQLNELRQSIYQKPMAELVLNISADQASKITVNFSFYTPEAGWQPLYDIRSPGADKPLNLVYKANIYQTTGTNWEKVKLVVSTGNPSVNNDRPILDPWYINFYEPISVVGYGGYDKRASMAKAEVMSNDMAVMEEMEEVVSIAEAPQPPVPYQVELLANQMSAEYAIGVLQDIPSDGKTHIVPIADYTLPAVYRYQSVPKLDPHAFLLAQITGYEQLNLLPGTLNLFFEGMYVGQSSLDPQVLGDSLLISLGRDDRISIQRNIRKDFTANQVVGSNRKVQKGYEIQIKNNKSYPVTLELLDQVPIPQNKEIEVEILDNGGAAYSALYGTLTWNLTLQPGESRKLSYGYQLKYPKDRQVND